MSMTPEYIKTLKLVISDLMSVKAVLEAAQDEDDLDYSTEMDALEDVVDAMDDVLDNLDIAKDFLEDAILEKESLVESKRLSV